MLWQQNVAIIGSVNFYSRINEYQVGTTKRRNRNGNHNRRDEIGTRTQQSVCINLSFFSATRDVQAIILGVAWSCNGEQLLVGKILVIKYNSIKFYYLFIKFGLLLIEPPCN